MPGFTVNHAVISGNLVRDPELRVTTGGTEICSMRLAVNERRKNKSTDQWEDRAMFFSVSVFGGLGKWLANNIAKGDGITCAGRLSWREWETDGNRREAVEIVADSIVPQRDRGGASSSSSSESDVPIDTGDLQPQTAAAAPSAADDDIPF